MDPELLHRLGISFILEPWVPTVFMIVLGVIALNLVASLFLRRLHRLSSKTTNIWDDALIQAAGRPLTVILWLVGLAFAIEVAYRETGSTPFEAVNTIRNVGVIACLAWFVVRLIRNVERNVLARGTATGELDPTTVDALSKLLRLSVIVTAGLVVLQNLGFSVTGVLAFGGIGGIAVGFAAKDLLANFFGGLTIYLDRPFSVGEWIRSPDKQIEGTVEYIGWRQTRIRAFNKNPIYVPNALFTTIVVENPSRMTNRRIKETIGIRYQDIDRMAGIVADVKAMLRAHPEIDPDKTLIVNFNEFAASSLNFFIYTFTRTTEWVRYHEIKQDVLLKVAAIIAAHGAEIAFPTQTLHLIQEGPETDEDRPGTAGPDTTPTS